MQGRLLADEYGYSWISTGEIFRVLITGKRRQEMLKGKLLSDEEVIKVIDTVLDLIDTSQEFILDGFPRSVAQAEWLSKQLEKGRFKLTAVVHLTASEEVVRERLMSRGRQDDTDEAIAERFKEYHNVTLPIIDHLKKEGIAVFEVNAAQDPQAVHKQIVDIVHGA